MDIEKLTNPDGIAVIGASRNPSKAGSVILKNLRISYHGAVFPVNQNTDQVQGLKSYKSVTGIKENVDIAVIATHAETVVKILKECEKKRIKIAIIISSEFANDNGKLKKELSGFLKKARLRVIGPNSLGVINTDPYYNCTFIEPDYKPFPGNTAFVSQSGPVLSAVLDMATMKRIGFSKIISIGDEIDIDSIKMLQFLSLDEKTKAIAIYSEKIEGYAKYIKELAEISEKTPLIFLRGDYGVCSRNRAKSNLDELILKRIGGISANSLVEFTELIRDAPSLKQKSNEVVVLTNSSSMGNITKNAIEASGLKLAKLTNAVASDLYKTVAKDSQGDNPIVLETETPPEVYKQAISILYRLNRPIIFVFSPHIVSMPIETAKQLVEARDSMKDITLLPVFIGGLRVEKGRRLMAEKNMHFFDRPGNAVSLAKSLYIHSCFSKPSFSMYNKIKINPSIKLDKKMGEEVIRRTMAKVGIRLAKSFKTENIRELGKAAENIGFPIKVYTLYRDKKTGLEKQEIIVDNREELKDVVSLLERETKNKKPAQSSYELVETNENLVSVDINISMVENTGVGLLSLKLNGPATNTEESKFLLPLSDSDLSEFKNSWAGLYLVESARSKILNGLLETMIKLSKLYENSKSIRTLRIMRLDLGNESILAEDFYLD